MNKFKKLILSLTITLLSYAGVEAMAKLPQFKTYREYSKFVSQYPTSDFLINKDVFGKGNPGLLQVLLNEYDKLPGGSKSLAENLFQAKFKLAGWQLRAKLASIRPASQIMADAETRIQNLTKENADLQAQIRSLSTETNDLTNNVNRTSPGNIAQLNKLEEQLEFTQKLAARINDRALDLLNDKSRLQKDIDDLRASGAASAAQIQKMQNQLNIADAALANATQKKANYQNTIKTLNEKVESLTAGLPGGKEAQPIFDALDAIIKDCTIYYTNQVANKIVINSIDIDKPETGINALSDINTLENIAKDAEALSKSMKDKVNNYIKEVNAEKDKWNKLNIPNESPLTKELDNKDNSINQILNKIDDKVKALNNVKNLADARITEVKEANAKAEAELIGEIQNWGQQPQVSLQALEVVIDNAKIAGTKFDSFDEATLKAYIDHAKENVKNADDHIGEYANFANKASAYPKAQAELSTLQNRIDKLNELKVLLNDNISKADAKIKQAGAPGPAEAGVSGVVVDLNNSVISFKIGDVSFKSDANDINRIKFIKNIVKPSITEATLTKAGEEIAKQAKNTAELTAIAGDVLRAEYDKATTEEQKKRIRLLMKPILLAYKNTPVPAGKPEDFYTRISAYKDILKGIYGDNIPNDL